MRNAGGSTRTISTVTSSGPIDGHPTPRRGETASHAEPGPRLDLDHGIRWKAGDADGRTGRPHVAHLLGVDGVERGELAHVGEEHERLGDLRDLGAVLREQGAD